MPKLGPVWLHRVFSEKINYPWTLMSRHEREVPVNRPSGTPRPVLFPALDCRQPGGLPLPQIIKVTVKEIQLLLWSKLASQYRPALCCYNCTAIGCSFCSFHGPDPPAIPHWELFVNSLKDDEARFFSLTLSDFWKDILLTDGPPALPVYPSVKKMSVQHWWNETDRWKPK